MRIHRGDIVIVDLDPTQGSEQYGTRPSLVVQNDVGNKHSSTTIIVPFTTSFGDQLYPFEVLIPADACALREDSVAQCSQIRTISIEDRIHQSIGGIPTDRMKEVEEAMEYSLGLIEV